MTPRGKTFPKDVVAHWPEVFGEINLNVVPLKYLHTISVTFKDGKIWEIDVNKNGKTNDWDSFEKEIQEIFRTYEDNIDNIDFQINTEKVKTDITKITNKFLKKKKL